MTLAAVVGADQRSFAPVLAPYVASLSLSSPEIPIAANLLAQRGFRGRARDLLRALHIRANIRPGLSQFRATYLTAIKAGVIVVEEADALRVQLRANRFEMDSTPFDDLLQEE